MKRLREAPDPKEQSVPIPVVPKDVDWREFFVEQLIRLMGVSAIALVLVIFLFLVRE